MTLADSYVTDNQKLSKTTLSNTPKTASEGVFCSSVTNKYYQLEESLSWLTDFSSIKKVLQNYIVDTTDIKDRCFQWGLLIQGLMNNSLVDAKLNPTPHVYSHIVSRRATRGVYSTHYDKINTPLLAKAHMAFFNSGILAQGTYFRRPTEWESGLTRDIFLTDAIYREIMSALHRIGVHVNYLKKFFKEFCNVKKSDPITEVGTEIIGKNISFLYKEFQAILDEEREMTFINRRNFEMLKFSFKEQPVDIDKHAHVLSMLGCVGVGLCLTNQHALQDNSGRFHNTTFLGLTKDERYFIYRGNNNYDFDIQSAHLAFIARIIGAQTLIDTMVEMKRNETSLWSLFEEDKEELKKVFYTLLFKSRYRSNKLRDEAMEVINKYPHVFGDFTDKLKEFYDSLPNQEKIVELSGKGDYLINKVGLPFIARKTQCKREGKGAIWTEEGYENLKGKILAHLACGYEQYIIQKMMIRLKNSFCYAYDGFIINLPNLHEGLEELDTVFEETLPEEMDHVSYSLVSIDTKEKVELAKKEDKIYNLQTFYSEIDGIKTSVV